METSRERQLEEENELLRQQLQATMGSDRELGALMALKHGMTLRTATMLHILVKRAPGVVSRQSFHTLIYGDRPDGGPEPKIFDVHISRLRSILERIGCPREARIDTVWNAGYRANPQLVTWIRGIYAERIVGEG